MGQASSWMRRRLVVELGISNVGGEGRAVVRDGSIPVTLAQLHTMRVPLIIHQLDPLDHGAPPLSSGLAVAEDLVDVGLRFLGRQVGA